MDKHIELDEDSRKTADTDTDPRNDDKRLLADIKVEISLLKDEMLGMKEHLAREKAKDREFLALMLAQHTQSISELVASVGLGQDRPVDTPASASSIRPVL